MLAAQNCGGQADGARRVGVIGGGIVGVCAASWLQRDGHSVFLVEPGNPGEGASFGNAGCFNGSSVTPVAMPGVIRQVPRWLMDPLGPLVGPTVPLVRELARAAGAEELVHQRGHLYVYRSAEALEKDGFAWALR